MALQVKEYCPNEEKLNILLYWASWAWKTTLASTWPRTLFICVENWLASIAKKKPLYVEVKTIAELKSVYAALSEWEDYDTIVLDSISELAYMIFQEITNNNKHDMNQRKRWQFKNEIILLMHTIKNMRKYHVVCIAHHKEEKDSEWNLRSIWIDIAGSAKAMIEWYFDIIAYCYKRKKEDVDGKTYFATIAASWKMLTKNRVNWLSDNLPLDIMEWIKVHDWETIKAESKIIKEIKVDALLEQKKMITSQLNEWISKKIIETKIKASEKLSDDDKKELIDFIKKS